MTDASLRALKSWALDSSETIAALINLPTCPTEARGFTLAREELSRYLEDQALFLPLTCSEGLVGPLLLALDGETSARLAQGMLGGEDGSEPFGPMHIEVLGEALRQLASFIPKGLAQDAKLRASITYEEPQMGPLPDLRAPSYCGFEFPIRVEWGEAQGQEELRLFLFMSAAMAEQLSAAVEDSAPEAGGQGTGSQAAATPARYAPISSLPRSAGPPLSRGSLDIILDVPLEVMVVLGRTSLMIEDLLELGEGSVLELDRLAGEPVELYVQDRLVARGEVVVVDERFGVKILEMTSGRPRRGQRAAAV